VTIVLHRSTNFCLIYWVMNIRVDKCLGRQMFGSTNVWVNKCSGRQMFGLTNVWVDECLPYIVGRRTSVDEFAGR
jgi:hypothetical protein